MRSSRTTVRTSQRYSHSSSTVEFAALESRLMFCGYHATAAGTVSHMPGVDGGSSNNSGTTRSSTSFSIPALNSLIGAKATIYLDFDGDAARTWGSYDVPSQPAYDTDGNVGAFSASEIVNINEIWARVAEKFSAFSINVTTVRPSAFDNGKALQVVIGGNGSWIGSPGGVGYVGSFTNSAPNTVYAFAKNLGNGYAKYVAEAISHETGHAFGLEHQSTYSGGSKTAEYASGTSVSAPTMGNSYSSARGLWWYGTSTNGTFQDDLAILSNSTNGFGYRADDFGGSPGTAKRTGWNNGKFMVKGLINNRNDRDYFRFDFTGGSLQLKLRGQGAGSMLDGWLRLYKQDGTLVKHVNTENLSETIVRTLSPGIYYAVVFSNGGYGDIGQYTLYGYDDVAGAPTAPSSAPSSAPTTTTSSSTTSSVFSTKAIGASALTDEIETLAA